MSQVLVTEQYLEDIADSIRSKNGSENVYTPAQMASAIDAFYPEPSGSVNIIQNGTYDVKSIASAVVSIAGSEMSGDYKNFMIACGEISGFIHDPLMANIRSSAFYYNSFVSGIEALSAQRIGNSAFYGCSQLMQASFPVCSYIGMDAFNRCSSLAQVHFPSCLHIGSNAFRDCVSLKQVSFSECSTIDNYAFSGCYQLSQVSFPSCTSIGPGAFMNCASLTQINFPICAYIGNSVFAGCGSLQTVSFPACENINMGAFMNCANLENVIILCDQVPQLQNVNAFINTPISNSNFIGRFGSIYVLSSLVDAYKSAQNWSIYSDRITAYEEE